MSEASAKTLEDRLRQVLGLEPGVPFNKETARDAIVREKLHGSVCARIPEVGGKLNTFSMYYGAVFGVSVEGSAYKPRVEKKK